MQFKLGLKPRVVTKTHLHKQMLMTDALNTLGPPPLTSDWHTKFAAAYKGNIGMFGNDVYGDCTIAEAMHDFMAWAFYASGKILNLTAAQAEAEYFKLTGGADDGLEIDDVTTAMEAGFDGHKVDTAVPIGLTNPAHRKWASALFGPLSYGIICTQSMQDQFGAGKILDYVPGSAVLGEHDVAHMGFDKDGVEYIATWGKIVPATPAFLSHYLQQIDSRLGLDWFNKMGMSPPGFNLAALIQKIKAVQN